MSEKEYQHPPIIITPEEEAARQRFLRIKLFDYMTRSWHENRFLCKQYDPANCPPTWDILGNWLEGNYSPVAHDKLIKHYDSGCVACRKKVYYLTSCEKSTSGSQKAWNGEPYVLVPITWDEEKDYSKYPASEIVTPERDAFYRRLDRDTDRETALSEREHQQAVREHHVNRALLLRLFKSEERIAALTLERPFKIITRSIKMPKCVLEDAQNAQNHEDCEDYDV